MTSPQQPPIPGYEPVRLLGINLGTLFLSRHVSTGELVALKVFRREDAHHVRDLHARLAGLDHPNILRLFGTGEFEESLWWCALEYVETTLADRLADGPLPEAQVASIAGAIASALHYARAEGMRPMHLSPGTILLGPENLPKLLDFCPVDAPVTLNDCQPLPFTAPEELNGVSTAATDVYRLGAVAYAMLTGRPPFGDRGGPVATARALTTERPVPPRLLNAAVSADMEALCMKCLAKRPEDRYVSTEALASALPPSRGQDRP